MRRIREDQRLRGRGGRVDNESIGQMVHRITRSHQLNNERRVGEKCLETGDVYLIRRQTAGIIHPTRGAGIDAISCEPRINLSFPWNGGRSDKIIVWTRPAITAPVLPIRGGIRPVYTSR